MESLREREYLRAGYCNRQPSLKQQTVVTGWTRLPAKSNLLGSASEGKSTEESDSKESKGFSPLGGQGNKPSRGENPTAACHKVVSVLMVPPQRARKGKELNNEVVC